jgi:class 3 adenylate cyclase
MVKLPTGTVTLLFTDIEGSTRLLHTLGPRYRDALEDHRAILRAAFSDHRGTEVDTQGDAFFIALPTPKDAVQAAIQAQRALTEHPWPQGDLRVRIGIHTGTPEVTPQGYVGQDVHLGARICAAAHARRHEGERRGRRRVATKVFNPPRSENSLHEVERPVLEARTLACGRACVSVMTAACAPGPQ